MPCSGSWVASGARFEFVDHGRWLLQWDGLLTFKAGVLGQTHPYTPMIGGQASGFGEAGYRFEHDSPVSLYGGLRLAAAMQVMAPWGVSLSALRTVNSVAGVGGVNLGGLLRGVVGASWLTGNRSLLLTAFVQESGRLGQPNRPGAAFTDVGVAARFDVARSLMLSAEGFWGVAPSTTDAALGSRDQTTHIGLAADVRKIFANGMWLGLRSSYEVESDATSYSVSGAAYHTTDAPWLTIALSYGYPLGGPP